MSWGFGRCRGGKLGWSLCGSLGGRLGLRRLVGPVCAQSFDRKGHRLLAFADVIDPDASLGNDTVLVTVGVWVDTILAGHLLDRTRPKLHSITIVVTIVPAICSCLKVVFSVGCHQSNLIVTIVTGPPYYQGHHFLVMITAKRQGINKQ